MSARDWSAASARGWPGAMPEPARRRRARARRRRARAPTPRAIAAIFVAAAAAAAASAGVAVALRTDSGTAIVASSTSEQGVGVVRGTSARDTASCGHGAERVLALELGHVWVCYPHFVRRVALLSYLARDAGASSSPCSRAWFCSLYISHCCRHQQSLRSLPAVVIREICSSRQLYRGGSASFDRCGLRLSLALPAFFQRAGPRRTSPALSTRRREAQNRPRHQRYLVFVGAAPGFDVQL